MSELFDFEQALVSVSRSMGPDERRVLLLVAERLAMGEGVYGQLAIATDRRDMMREASEELIDAAVYLAIATLQRSRAE